MLRAFQLVLVGFLLLGVEAITTPAVVFSQSYEGEMTDTDVIAGTALESAGTTYTAALADASYLWVDVWNDTDCKIQVRLDDKTGTPATIIGVGQSEILKPGEHGGHYSTSVSIRKYTGETCSTGNVFSKGGY